jgi:tripartite-type tricarboxylate transporter receptor subunit TctC
VNCIFLKHYSVPCINAIKDFTPIGMIGATPNVLAINASLPVKNIREFVDYVKQNPGRINYGSAGPGSLTHLTMELFKQETGSFIVHIPYRGIAPAINDLLGGQTQAMFPGLAAALPHLRSGRMRALAVTGKQRSPQVKDVPTMEEAGFKGFDAMQWYGSVGPAGLPADIVRRLNETQVAVLKAPDLAEKLAGEAVEPWPMTPDEFGSYIRAEIQRWTALARARKIQLDE